MVSKPSLSQEEMSELAQALAIAKERMNAPRSEVRSYSFSNPDKLSKLQIKALQMVFSSLERTWSGSLSVAMKGRVAVQVNPVQQASFGAYTGSLGTTGAVYSLATDVLPGNMLVDIPLQLAWSLVDRMVGGTGKITGRLKPLTDMQKNVLKSLIVRLLPDLGKAWEHVAPVQLSATDVHSSADEIDFDAHEPMIVASTIWNTGSVEGMVNIAFPISALDGIMDSLDPQRWLKTEEPKKVSPESMTGLLKAVDVPMSVELGRAQISMRDVVNMEVGDVVMLDAGVNDALQVKVGEKTRFQARPGLVGKKVSVQIVDAAGHMQESLATVNAA